MDRARRLVRRGAEAVRISPKAFQLLEILLDESPRVVPKAELLARLWPGAFVVEANLSNLVAEIRSAIGDSSRQPQWLKTVHAFGYGIDALPPSSPEAVRGELSLFYWLVYRNGRVSLPEGKHLIGRHPRSVVPIGDSTVSRRHARIAVTPPGGGTLTDLGSRNGTFVRCVRVHAPLLLHDGDWIEVGAVQLEFLVTDSREPTDELRR